MSEILQHSLPYDITTPRPLPGISPLDPAEWLAMDEAFAAQLALKEQLLSTRRADVLALSPEASAAAQELLDLVLDTAYDGARDVVRRPDGVSAAIDRTDPLGSLARIIQEDVCILQKHGDEHVLTGALLCFPASWRLSEKYMQPLTGIHVPVGSYDANIAKRVQRLFDGVRVGRPLWRYNALWYSDPSLHQPRTAHVERDADFAASAPYLRSEKQSMLRLPKTDAVVFSIHTFVLPRAAVPRGFQGV